MDALEHATNRHQSSINFCFPGLVLNLGIPTLGIATGTNRKAFWRGLGVGRWWMRSEVSILNTFLNAISPGRTALLAHQDMFDPGSYRISMLDRERSRARVLHVAAGFFSSAALARVASLAAHAIGVAWGRIDRHSVSALSAGHQATRGVYGASGRRRTGARLTAFRRHV